MNRLAPIAWVLLLAFAAAVVAQDTNQAYTLRPQWEPGHESRYHFWTIRQTKTIVQVAGQSQEGESRVDFEGEVTWRVDQARPDGSYLATMTLDWMTANITGAGGQGTQSDSRKGGNTPVDALLRAMSGAPLKVEVAPDGSIRSVSGMDAMRHKVQQPDMVPEELDFIETAADLATIWGAPPEVRPGGTWDADWRWTHEMGHMRYDVTYRLDGVGDIEGVPVATVSGEADLALDFDRSKIPQDAPPVDAKLLRGDYKSQILYDLTRDEAVGRDSLDQRTVQVTVRHPMGTLTTTMEETLQNQVLRVSEGE